MSRKRNRTSKTNTAAESSGQDLPIAESLVHREKSTINYFKWIGLLVAFLSVWTPFFGYAYINAYLSKIGFQSVAISVDIYKLVLVFFVATFDGVFRLITVDLFAPFKSQVVFLVVLSLLLGISVAIGSYARGRINFNLKFDSDEKWSLKKSTKFGLAAFILAFLTLPTAVLVSSVLFVFLIGVFWLTAMAGYFLGVQDAVADFNKGFCFQSDIEKSCASIRVDGRFLNADVLYSDSSYTYVITPSGLITINAAGSSVFMLPMSDLERRLRKDVKSTKSDAIYQKQDGDDSSAYEPDQ